MEQDMVMFKQQIEEDIALIQKDLLYIDNNLSKEAYAFNYWVLSRIFVANGEWKRYNQNSRFYFKGGNSNEYVQ